MMQIQEKKGSGNYTPFIVVLLMFVVLAVVLNYTLTAVGTDTSVANPDSTTFQVIVDYMSGGFAYDLNVTIFGISFTLPTPNIFALLPNTMQNWLVEQAVVLSYVPDWFLIPFSIFFIISVIWFVVALIKPGSN